ncbi:MAG: purine/pyrimidine permease [Syntrophales bacterium]|nr:purine/pyrimidine permease [Syntrophales bacterium]
MDLKYGLEDRLPLRDAFLNGLQWFVVILPVIVVLGKVTGDFQSLGMGGQVIYMQRLMFMMGIVILAQILVGHGLPLVVGPSAALLVGLISSAGNSSPAAVYSAIMLGGGCVAILGLMGAFRYLKFIFTHRVVNTIIFLIAASLLPLVLRLILSSEGVPFFNLLFALAVIMLTVVLHNLFTGVVRSTVIIWVMMGASLFFFFVYEPLEKIIFTSPFFSPPFTSFKGIPVAFDLGVFVSFFFCFLALVVNDVASVQSVNEFISPAHREARVSRSLLVTGLANLLSGFFGIIGPVNYSLSPGVISSSRCASRFPLFITAGLLVVFSCFPCAIGILNHLPGPIVGAILAYLLGAQVMAGISMWREGNEEMDFDRGLTMAIPVVITIIVSFMPSSVFSDLSPSVRPVAQNGFLMGLLSSVFLEGIGWVRRRFNSK